MPPGTPHENKQKLFFQLLPAYACPTLCPVLTYGRLIPRCDLACANDVECATEACEAVPCVHVLRCHVG
eukprot:3793625-Rhodomonas_salina.1